MPPALLFDLDGTLIDSRRDLADSVNAVRATWDADPLPVETITGFIGDGVLKLLERALSDVPDASPREDALPLMRDAYAQRALNHTRPYSHVPEALDALRQLGCPMAVVTNKPEDRTRQILDGLNLTHYFTAVAGGDTTPRLKPHPDPLIYALDKIGGTTDNAWMLGDNWTDLDSAAALKIPACFCAYGFGRQKNSKAQLTIHTLTEFVRHLSAR